MRNVCLFEDGGWRGLLPLTWLHPVWEMHLGAHTVLSRAKLISGTRPLTVHCRSWLEEVVRERFMLSPVRCAQQNTLFVNGRVVDIERIVSETEDVDGEFGMWMGEELIAFRLAVARDDLPEPEQITDWVRQLELPPIQVEVRTFSRWWHLVHMNEEILREDSCEFDLGRQLGSVFPGARLVEPGNIFSAPDSVIEDGAVIDAREGPVIVEKGVRIGAGAVVVGPVFLGTDCRVKPLSHIGPVVSLGPSCRVSGEISSTIFQGYGNKQHYGFLGHAYVSSWVNLGAGTTNSNLKNTYGKIKAWVDGRMESTGETFVGCAIADHTKTAIGTVLNTGTVTGVACNIFGQGFPPKYIPSFAWGFDARRANLLKLVISTASKVMSRRGKTLTDAETALLSGIWERTKYEREKET